MRTEDSFENLGGIRPPIRCRFTGQNRSNPTALKTAEQIGRVLKFTRADVSSGRFGIMLYRFLSRSVPVISSCIWTWVRLAAAPGRFVVAEGVSEAVAEQAGDRLERLSRRLYADGLGNRLGLVTLMPDLFTSVFRDGAFAGFLTVRSDASGVDCFVPVDPVRIVGEEKPGGLHLALELDEKRIDLDRPDFYYLPHASSATDPMGRSILQSVPFVTYVEQQLVDDMRRASHNSGFHRLHVKVTPPERMAGESDAAYGTRINGYFDDTVEMIRSCEVDDNPVTWDNVAIDHVGPAKPRDSVTSWFMTHRAMIEDICAGTNLAPYLLGYSYGATTTWSGFKFDVVMRQVRSVQAEAAQFLEWIGNVDLALGGLDARCRFVFDNTLAYQAMDRSAIETSRVDNILKLYQAGLIDESTAREKAGELL